MMQKGKAIVWCMIVILIVGLLGGCSLAKEDAGGEQQENSDRLVGIFLTTEYLDLFDMDAYLNDHLDEIVDGENIIAENDDRYNGRIYGTVEKHGTTEAKDCENWEIRFDDLEGIAFFYSEWQEEGQEPFSMLMIGDEICDVTQHLNVTDVGESVYLAGTMYALVKENVENAGFYMNPVYMTADGAYYVTAGMGHYQGGIVGGNYTVKLEEEATITEDGEKQVWGGAVELTVSLLASEPAKIRLHYMDEALGIIRTEEVKPGEVPTRLEAGKDTVCIVAETIWEDGSVTRELVEKHTDETSYIETFYKVSEIALGKMDTEVVWE